MVASVEVTAVSTAFQTFDMMPDFFFSAFSGFSVFSGTSWLSWISWTAVSFVRIS